jgi:hypothetical protein
MQIQIVLKLLDVILVAERPSKLIRRRLYNTGLSSYIKRSLIFTDFVQEFLERQSEAQRCILDGVERCRLFTALLELKGTRKWNVEL